MRVWVTRPDADACRTAGRLAALGHVALVAPVLTVRPTRDVPPDGPFDAMMLTSANAVAALDEVGRAGLTARARGIPVLAVGARTAQALRAIGLAATSADGDAGDLAALAAAMLPTGARLIHVTGRLRKAEPARTLAAAGVTVVPWETYVTERVARLLPSVEGALATGHLDAVLHYSRRSAETALALARAAGLEAAFAALAHHCLSADVAAPLVAAGLACHVVAARPDEAALLAGLAPSHGGRA